MTGVSQSSLSRGQDNVLILQDTWGFADIEGAIAALPSWIQLMSWTGPLPSHDIAFIGHSNGGQGTWFALTHKPDMVRAAAPVSGYLSIQSYVPYQFWTEVDPKMGAVVQTALSSYRLELLSCNFAGIPVLQQHSLDDDNVPAFQSRRMNQKIFESQGPASNYSEVTGGHWFDGVMVTPPLVDFYKSLADPESRQKLPQTFRYIIPNSADMGSRGGLIVDQLVSPDQFGVTDVERKASSQQWIIRTSNVLRFHLSPLECAIPMPLSITVDGVELPRPREWATEHTYFKNGGTWEVTFNSPNVKPQLTHGSSRSTTPGSRSDSDMGHNVALSMPFFVRKGTLRSGSSPRRDLVSHHKSLETSSNILQQMSGLQRSEATKYLDVVTW